jgi:PKD repeat protein
VTVNGGNTAPTANAGPDQTISLPTNSVSLSGTGSDDGLPVGSTLTYVWSKVSGPGTVTFANANTHATSATFSTNGTYVLRLTVSDSSLTGTDDVTIVVNRAPIVSAGVNQSVDLPTNSVSLAGTVTDDGLPTGAAVTSTWSKFNGPGTVTFANAASPTTTATFSTAGIYTLELAASDTLATTKASVTITVNAANQAPSVNAGADQTISLPANSVSLIGMGNDDGKPVGAVLAYSWTKVSGPVAGTVTFSAANAKDTNATFSAGGVYTLRLTVSDTLLSGNDDVVITVNSAPVVNAGLDQIITLPIASTTLTGTYADDNLPTPVALSHQWTVISGPGSVTFSDPTSLMTSATFGQGGSYALRLTTSDSLVSGSDDITVIVNTAPSANAGLDQLISLPNTTVALAGAGSDPDLLPTNAPLTYSWTKFSGPVGSNVTFSAANAQNTNATFSAPGLYRLLLTVFDGAATGSDEIIVIVNTAPTVNAGADHAINFNQTATLNGSGSDPDGFPTGAALGYAWSQVSGPVNSNVTFGTPNLAATSATFSASGVYTLRLSVRHRRDRL